ncbi:Hypothetical protein A7982_04015 [Minicystis rosea]|nr:Hypothetical protein A7982_04015 [Minicystis rosea]
MRKGGYRGDPLPTARNPSSAEAIRDALGLVRILYAARRAREAAPAPGSDPLVAVGRELAAALSLSAHEEGSLGHRAALDRAARALARLGDEVTATDTAWSLARAARTRVLGEKAGATREKA